MENTEHSSGIMYDFDSPLLLNTDYESELEALATVLSIRTDSSGSIIAITAG